MESNELETKLNHLIGDYGYVNEGKAYVLLSGPAMDRAAMLDLLRQRIEQLLWAKRAERSAVLQKRLERLSAMRPEVLACYAGDTSDLTAGEMTDLALLEDLDIALDLHETTVKGMVN